MRAVIAVSFGIALAVVAMAAPVSDSDIAKYLPEFETFKTKFNRVYSSPAEEEKRFVNFVASRKRAAVQQAANPLARFGLTNFSDLSEQEWRSRYTNAAFFRSAMRKRASEKVTEDVSLRSRMQQYVDWRDQGVVTGVKNQAQCGGCWAFSTTGNIEGQWAIAGNALVSLSEQELISCDDTCNGCHGGNYELAFQWLLNAQGGGITSEAQYPFQSGSGYVPPCSGGTSPAAYISSYQNIAHDESAMAAWVSAYGPASIAVDATSLESYTGGILTSCISNQVDHAILIVGYNLESSPPYWIIKNQWADTWGEGGYLWLAYGSNQCLITTLPASSTVSSAAGPLNHTFSQSVCGSSSCSENCEQQSFPTRQCLPLSAGGSAVATCGADNLHLKVFQSSDCTGSSQTQEIPLDQCVQGSQNYTYMSCSTSMEIAAPHTGSKLRLRF